MNANEVYLTAKATVAAEREAILDKLRRQHDWQDRRDNAFWAVIGIALFLVTIFGKG